MEFKRFSAGFINYGISGKEELRPFEDRLSFNEELNKEI